MPQIIGQWLENNLVWNAAIAALQFWTADLDAHILSNSTEEVYSAFFIQHQHIHYISNLMKYYLLLCDHLKLQPLNENWH